VFINRASLSMSAWLDNLRAMHCKLQTVISRLCLVLGEYNKGIFAEHSISLTLSYLQHLESLCGKLTSRIALLRLRHAGSGWCARADVLRTAALALVYSTAEYCDTSMVSHQQCGPGGHSN